VDAVANAHAATDAVDDVVENLACALPAPETDLDPAPPVAINRDLFNNADLVRRVVIDQDRPAVFESRRANRGWRVVEDFSAEGPIDRFLGGEREFDSSRLRIN
jgi:hypothetical protein